MNIKNYITYILLTLYAITMYYLWWIYAIIEFILSLTFYTLIFYFFHYLWTKFRKKPIMYIYDFINYFLNRVAVLLIVLISIIWWGAILSNEVFPAPMPEYTITDWKKIVKFQAMSHIWNQKFYEQIVKNLTEFKKDWWVYFYEWVKPWTKENWDKFNKAMWMNFDKDLYKNFSKLYWVTHQDNSIFMWLVNDKDFNVDLNMDQIVTLYEEKTKWKPEYESKIPLDANKTILDTLAWLNDKQLKILVYINQAILNFIIWSDKTQWILTDNFTNKDLFDVILWKRNEILSNAIIKSDHEKIYITYWLLHFKWVFELLKKNNPNWQITSTRNYYPISNKDYQ